MKHSYTVTTKLIGNGSVWFAEGVKKTPPYYVFAAFGTTRDEAIDRLAQAIEVARSDYRAALMLNGTASTETRTETLKF